MPAHPNPRAALRRRTQLETSAARTFQSLKIEQVKRLKELELENNRLRRAVSDLTLDKLILHFPGKLLSPARRRACIEQVRAQLHVSERRACAALGHIARHNARSRAAMRTRSV